MRVEDLPPIVQQVARDYPRVWEAYNRLGEAAAQAGPVRGDTERLVKLALAAGAGLEGGVRSQTRRSLAAGITLDQLRHVALLGVTTIGWPSAIAALSWIESEAEDHGGTRP
jgi:alkylhydroperoxidase/carboxymuconolactone decarboxylase family protein YurZ